MTTTAPDTDILNRLDFDPELPCDANQPRGNDHLRHHHCDQPAAWHVTTHTHDQIVGSALLCTDHTTAAQRHIERCRRCRSWLTLRAEPLR